MTQVAIRRDLPTRENDRVVPFKDLFIPEQEVAQEERGNSTSKIFLIDALEDKELAREKKITEGLNEIRAEAEEICAVDNDVELVPESAYANTRSLLNQISFDIPLPDMMWLEDGGIGLEWRPGDGIVTMSLYGDEHVTFVAIVDKQHKIAGTCPLSDQLLLPNFLATLPILF